MIKHSVNVGDFVASRATSRLLMIHRQRSVLNNITHLLVDMLDRTLCLIYYKSSHLGCWWHALNWVWITSRLLRPYLI